jgi:hypothetical protein
MHRFLSCQDKSKVKGVFLVHGETEVEEKYKMYLEERGFPKVYIPQREGVEL